MISLFYKWLSENESPNIIPKATMGAGKVEEYY